MARNRWLTGILAASALALAATASAGTVRFDGDGHAENPVWSRDGRYVAFEVNRFAGATDLMIAEISGDVARTPRRVTLPGGSSGFGGSAQVAINPTWHPAAGVIFEGSNQGGQFRLYMAPPTTGTAQELISSTQVAGDLTFPSVSPDGMKVVFVSDLTGEGDLRVYEAGRINPLPTTDETEMFPQFSRDNTKLAFTRKRNGIEAIFLRDVATGAETPIASGNGDRTRPSFATDRVVYFSSELGVDGWEISSVDLRGQNRQTLGRSVRLPVRGRPAVSPDGQWVAYGSADPTQSSKIFLVKADGSSRVEVQTEFVACGEPAITVTGGRTLLAFTALPGADAAWRFLHVIDITGRI